jgi:hypothetical protein
LCEDCLLDASKADIACEDELAAVAANTTSNLSDAYDGQVSHAEHKVAPVEHEGGFFVIGLVLAAYQV